MVEKKNLLIYLDWEEALFSLSRNDRLEMYDALFLYSKYGTIPEFSNKIILSIFYLMKNAIDRDNEKYLRVCERNKENGKKGGRPAKADKSSVESNETENPAGFSKTKEKAFKPKKADNDNDNDNDNENENENDNENDIDNDNVNDIDKHICSFSTSSFSAKKEYSENFSEFWNIYPKKIGKGGAYKVFQKLNLTDKELSDIRNALVWQKKSEQWQKNNGQFIPNPSTYLSQRRWEDEPLEALKPNYTDPDRYNDIICDDLPF